MTMWEDPDFRKTLPALAAVLILASVLRLPGIESIPRWDWDEGYNRNYASHLSEGRMRWFSINYAFVPHPPLYLLALACVETAFGTSIVPARLFSVALSIVTLLLVYSVSSMLRGRWFALVASFLYAIYPAQIYWGRTALGNNMLGLMCMVSLYCFMRYLKEGGVWWLPSCAFAVACALTEYAGFCLVFSLGLYFLVWDRGRLRQAFLYMAAPLTAYAALLLAVRGDFVVEELLFQLNRFDFLGLKALKYAVAAAVGVALLHKVYGAREGLRGFLAKESEIVFGGRGFIFEALLPGIFLVMNVAGMMTLALPFSDGSIFKGADYYWAGFAGILAVGPPVLVHFIPLFAAAIFILRVDHMLVQLHPFMCVGAAALLFQSHKIIAGFAGSRRGVSFVSAILLGAPFAAVLIYDFEAFAFGSGFIMHEDVSSAYEAVGYVNSVAGGDRLVIATSNVAPLLHADTTVMTQVLAYDGFGIEYYRANLSKGWFARNISVDNADYILEEGEPLKWLEGKGRKDVADRLRMWPQVFQSGSYVVLRNPRLGTLTIRPSSGGG